MVDGKFCYTRKAFLPFCNAKEPFRRSYFIQLRREKALFLQKIKKFLAQSTTDSFFLPTRGTFALATIGEKA